MSYVIRVNPFKGILCMPFYYLFIPVIVSWILTFVEVLHLYLIVHLRKKLSHKKDNLETTVTKKFLLESRRELETFIWDDIHLPPGIISIIMEMLPDKYENWKDFCDFDAISNSIEKQKIALKLSLYIYPAIRVIANLINFVLIMYQYGIWHRDHPQISNWDKYCAFVIALLYLPTHAGHGFSTTVMFANIYVDDTEIESVTEYLIAIGFLEFFIYISLILIISLPIWIAGFNVFMPNVVFFIVICIIVSALYHFVMKYLVQKDDYEFNWLLLARVSSLTVIMWFLVVTLVSAMEFFDGLDWVHSYGVGFLGEYCDAEDHVHFNKWNEYTMDIQFLIISWFLF